jgi:acyl carrier protein
MPQTVDELQDQIRKIVAKIIEVEPEKIGPETHFVEELGADSMMALEIMAMLEKKFNITIPEEDLPKMSNLKEVVNLVSGLTQ